MNRHRRRQPSDDAPVLLRISPAIVLLVSAHPASPARAAPPDSVESPVEALRADDAGAPGAGTRAEASVAGPLLFPLDPADAADSALVRALLLSHGIELDLGEGGTFAPADLTSLLRALQAAGGVDLDIGDLGDLDVADDTGFDLTLAIDTRRLDGVPGGVPDADMDADVDPDPGPDGAPTGTPAASDAAAVAFEGWRRTRLALRGVSAPAVVARAVRAAVPAPVVVDCPLPRASLDALIVPDARPDDATLLDVHAALDVALRGARSRHPARGTRADVSVRWRRLLADCGLEPAPAPAPALPSTAGPSALVFDAATGFDADVDAGIDAGVDADVDPRTDPDADSSATRDTGAARPDGDDGDGTSIFSVSDDLPPGFEGLGGPVSQLVDVYLNDRRLGPAGITVTSDEFRFDAVDEVVALLDRVDDVTPLLPVLSAPMATNAARRCFADGDPAGCGTVPTDSVAALYDERALRLDLFVASAFLPIDGDGARYLEPPERRPSAILSLGLAATDGESARSLDAVGGVLVGFGATHLSASADYTSRGDRSRLRGARVTRFAGDFEYGLGSFGFSPGAGLLDADLVAASMSTSYRLRTDAERVFAGELIVYLQRRAVVQLLVDDRVQYAESLPAGNRRVDASALPEGTYELTIRVLEDGRLAREETRLYTKGTSLPPPGRTVLGLTAGLPLSFDDGDGDARDIDRGRGSLGDERFLPRIERVPVFGVSAARRLSDRNGLRLGILQVGDLSVGQVELQRLGPTHSLQLGGSVGERGVLAGRVGASLVLGDWSATLSHSSARADATLADNAGDEPVFERFFPADGDQTFLSVGRAFGRTRLGARVSRRRGGDAEPRTEYALQAGRRLFGSGTLSASLEADWVHVEDGDSRASLRFRMNFGAGRVRGTAYAGGAAYDGGDWSPVAGAGIGTGSRATGTLRWEAGVRADATPDERRFGVAAEVEHPWFAANASTDWSVDAERDGAGGGTSRTSVASLRSQLGIDARGAAVGGVDYAAAGVIVDVGGNPAGELFDIRIDGADVGTGEVGSPRFIALPPFRAYRVALVPRGVLSNGIGERTHDFTLLPGTVQRIEVEARREVLLIATLADERGAPVVDATFRTERGPVLIDSSGIFQAEVAPGATFEVRRDGAVVCTFEVPDAGDDDEWLIPDLPLRCRTPGVASATGASAGSGDAQ